MSVTKVVTGIEPIDEFLATLREGQGPEHYQVYRIPTGQGRNVYLGPVDAEVFNLDYLQEAYGGGKFQIKAIRDNQYMKSITIAIDGRPKIDHDPDPPAAPAAPPPQDDDRIARLERMVERLADGYRGGGGITPEVIQTMLTSQTTMLVPLLTAMSSREKTDMTELLSVFREGMKIGKSAVPQTEEKRGSDGFLAFMNQALASMPSPPEAPQLPPPQEYDDPGAGPDPSDPLLPQWAVMVRPYLGRVSQALEWGVDPDAIVDRLYSLLPPVLGEQMASDPEQTARLILQMDPGLNEHAAAVVAIVGKLGEIYGPDDDDDDEGPEE